MSARSMRTRRLYATLGTGLALLGATAGALATAHQAEARTSACVYYVKVFAYVRENPARTRRS